MDSKLNHKRDVHYSKHNACRERALKPERGALKPERLALRPVRGALRPDRKLPGIEDF